MTTDTMFLRATELADKVSYSTRQVSLGRVLTGAVVLVPFLLGWLVGTALRTGLIVLVWFWSAAQIGYQAGRAGRPDDSPGGG